MKGIFWLASYPKSGNTWMRIFLRNYLRNEEQPADINDNNGSKGIASDRSVFDQVSGLESSLLTEGEIAPLRPLVYERISVNEDKDVYIKIHDACTLVTPELPITSIKGTKGTLYILRNPLDVAISWAHFINKNVDDAIARLEKEDYALSENKDSAGNQLFQQLFSWSRHVESWVGAPWFPVEVVRYEEMKANPFAAFGRVVRFLGLPFEEKRLEKAIAFSSFNELKRQEEQYSFREKPCYTEHFFRKGEAGGWKNVLTVEQVRRVIAVHERVMSRFGYLDDAKAWLAERERKG